MTTEKINIYDEITAKIITALEDGVNPWARSWKSSSLGPLRNAVSGRPYRGINTLVLSLTSMVAGYLDPRWLTLKNANQLGGRVRKGQKGTPIVFWKFISKEEGHEGGEEQPANGEDENRKVFPFARRYTVFNVEQCDGLELEALELDGLEGFEIDETETNEQAEKILALPNLQHGGDRACYLPSADKIFMPPRSAFTTLNHYYSTGYHEITHWTKHPSRLDRDFDRRFKVPKEAKAMEELVAELGAAFLGGHTGVPFEDMQHPEYIGSWLQSLKNDNKAIFTAAAKAQTATDFVLDKAGISVQGSNLPEAAEA